MPGVTAVRVMTAAGKEVQWEGAEIAAVAAVTEEIAHDAVRKIKVEYEVLPHLVREDDLAKAGARAKAGRRAGHRRSRQGFQGSRRGLRRHLRHSGDHALLPGAARQYRRSGMAIM